MWVQVRQLLNTPGTRSRWLALFIVARLAAGVVAAGLLLFHKITDHDGLLALIAVGYALVTALGAARVGRPRWLEAAWTVDAAATLGLVLAAGNWRSPFYLLALTALILPATTLPMLRAVGFTVAFTAGFFAIAALTGVDWSTLETTARLESFTTHLLLPLLTGVGLAYSSELLRRLDAERRRSERLALEAERRRLARELHDSAKQRLHAAHLVLSAQSADGRDAGDGIRLAMRELEAALAEMDASLSELRAPAVDGSLVDALRRRAARLADVAGVRVSVDCGELELSAPVAAHVYHVVAEALVNAVRHADASEVKASLRVANGRLVATVADDGRGLPREAAWDSHGVRSMFERAELIGGRLVMGGGRGNAGTSVRLEVPLTGAGGARA